jgi:hypothetical protein
VVDTFILTADITKLLARKPVTKARNLGNRIDSTVVKYLSPSNLF